MYNLALGLLSRYTRTARRNMLNKVLLVSALFWSAISFVQADTGSEPYRLAVVKMSIILNQSPQAEAASNKLRNDYAERERLLAKEQESVQAAEDDFRNNRFILSADELVKLESELRKRQRDLKRNREDLREEVRVAKDQALSDLQSNVSAAIEAIRDQEKIDIVFRESDYLVASKRVDITNKVLRHLHSVFQRNQQQNEKTNEGESIVPDTTTTSGEG